MPGTANGAILEILPSGHVLKRGRSPVVRAIMPITSWRSRMLSRKGHFRAYYDALPENFHQVDDDFDDDQDDDSPFQA